MKKIMLVVTFIFSITAIAIPGPPANPQHPGFPSRGKEVVKISINYLRDGNFLFLPKNQEKKVPLVVFAHGQALSLKNYELLFEELASKGVAVFYPKYDKGFFDTDWYRMGEDYDSLVIEVLKRYEVLDPERVVYSGHSKGGYVGLMALGHRGEMNNRSSKRWSPKASIFYSPAGYQDDALRQIESDHPLHLVWPAQDSIIDKSIINEIFSKSASLIKQKIIVQGYEELEAGHFFPLTKKAIFGGANGIGPFHYYGILPWTIGAIEDSEFLYGDLVNDSGDEAYPHLIERSF